MLNRFLIIALTIIMLPVIQLSSDTHDSYVLTDQEIAIDNHISPDLGTGGNDQPDKPFIQNPTLVITLFLLGCQCLFTTIVRVARNKQLLTPVFYQSNFVV